MGILTLRHGFLQGSEIFQPGTVGRVTVMGIAPYKWRREGVLPEDQWKKTAEVMITISDSSTPSVWKNTALLELYPAPRAVIWDGVQIGLAPNQSHGNCNSVNIWYDVPKGVGVEAFRATRGGVALESLVDEGIRVHGDNLDMEAKLIEVRVALDGRREAHLKVVSNVGETRYMHLPMDEFPWYSELVPGVNAMACPRKIEKYRPGTRWTDRAVLVVKADQKYEINRIDGSDKGWGWTSHQFDLF